jgi:hypothetical protein
MATFEILKEQLVRLRGVEMRNVTKDTIISQVLDSRSFLTVLINLEKALQITVSDEEFYERSPITLGEFANLLADLTAEKSAPRKEVLQ